MFEPCVLMMQSRVRRQIFRPVIAPVYLQPCCSRRADKCDVLPGDLRQRIRKLLKPAVICEAAVINTRVGQNSDLERAAIRRLRFRRLKNAVLAVTAFAGSAEFGIMPSCTTFRQLSSNDLVGAAAAGPAVAGDAADAAHRFLPGWSVYRKC